MRLFNDRQLLAILTTAVVLFAVAAIRWFPVLMDREPHVSHRAQHVYELRGNISREGYYCFDREQTLDQLSRSCGRVWKKEFIRNINGGVKSGSRVIFNEDVKIYKIDARASINFFMPISVNSSSAEDLTIIPGIGMKTAKAIVDFREQCGGIKKLSDMTGVKGIGEKRLASIVPFLTVD